VQTQINTINTSLTFLQSGIFRGITNTGNLQNNNGDINVSIGRSIYITNGLKFKGMHHNDYDAYFDYVCSLNYSDATAFVANPTSVLKIDGSNATFSKSVKAPAIAVAGTITCNNISAASSTITSTNIDCANITATVAISCGSLSGDVRCTSNLIVGNQLTVSNGLIVNSLNNQSKHFILKVILVMKVPLQTLSII